MRFFEVRSKNIGSFRSALSSKKNSNALLRIKYKHHIKFVAETIRFTSLQAKIIVLNNLNGLQLQSYQSKKLQRRSTVEFIN